MIFEELPFSGAYLISQETRVDDRGTFARMFCANEFRARGLNTIWVQMNRSANVKAGTLRGLHFQYPPAADIKMITCLQGAIFDVLVDVRRSSVTRGQWLSIELSEVTKKALYIPEGCAHGFQTLAANTEILYLHSASYCPEHEEGINHADTQMNIEWPKSIEAISVRDLNLPPLEKVSWVEL